jgi:hypothetical protein
LAAVSCPAIVVSNEVSLRRDLPVYHTGGLFHVLEMDAGREPTVIHEIERHCR